MLYDIDTSLKAHMYAIQNPKLAEMGWDGQWPPKHYDNKEYQEVVAKAREHIAKNYPEAAEVPTIPSMVGRSLHHLSQVHDMDMKHRVVAKINEDKCL